MTSAAQIPGEHVRRSAAARVFGALRLRLPGQKLFAGRGMRGILAEPLIQFFLIGGTLFLAYEGFQHAADRASNTIVIDDSVVARQGDLYRVQTGAAPDPRKIAALISQYVRDEVLYREAVRKGLLADDEIVRRRLIQKMNFLAADSPAEPSEQQLRTYYQAHPTEFSTPGARAFHHLYFSADHGDVLAKRRAQQALEALGSGADENRFGDAFALQSSYTALSRASAREIFGDTPFVAGLFDAPQGRWVGPYRSGYGWHLVRVDRIDSERHPPFGEVRSQVRAAFMESAEREARAANMKKLLRKYRVAVRYKGGAVAQDQAASILHDLDD